MASLNSCSFIGNLGKDPEIRTVQSGEKVANFSIACSEQWKDKTTGEKKEATEWVNVVVWGALAGVVEAYLRKGSKVFINGKMKTRKWTDKEGKDRWSTEIVLQGFDSKLIMLDGTKQGDGGQSAHGEAKQNGYQPQGRASADLDDIPF